MKNDLLQTNYRVAYEKFWQDVKEKDPQVITKYLAVTFDSLTQQFSVQFFGEEYILDCAEKTIYRKRDNDVPEMMACIILLNYLAYAGPVSREDRWVSLKEIPGGVLFYPAFYKHTISALNKTFGQQSQTLLSCSRALGGQKVAGSGVSVEFLAFPEIPLRVTVWEGDEEVPANATLLYTPSIETRLHIESVIGLGMHLAGHLRKIAKAGHEEV